MKKVNLKNEKNFDLAFKNHQSNNFKIAEKIYKKVLKINPSHFQAIFYLGSLFFQTKSYNKAKQFLEKSIKIYPQHAFSHHFLGNIFKEIGDNKKARKCFEKAIKIKPDLVAAHNNLGNIFKEEKENKKAKECFEKAIKIQPNLLAAHNNLGIVFHTMKDYQKAIACFKKAILINNKFYMAHYNLGKVYKESKKYSDAIKCFKIANTVRSRAELLESMYFFNGLEFYSKKLKNYSKEDPLNLRIATLAAYASKKEHIKNIYPFCRNPLDYVFIKNLNEEIDSSGEFIKKLYEVLSKSNFIWEPATKTTEGGYHSSGNLFNSTSPIITKLIELIKKEIDAYRIRYKLSKDYFITKWPKKSKIEAWHVKLLKQGYQTSHIHPSGWLSGCFYLKIPKVLKKNEGAIKFTLSGYDYPIDKKLPNLIHVPKNLDIALFPSSLFHETIPFSSKEERHVIAFDVMPK